MNQVLCAFPGPTPAVWLSPPVALLPLGTNHFLTPTPHTDTSIFCSLKITCCHQRTGCSTPRPTRCPSITGTAPPWPGTATNPLSPCPCLRDASTFLGSGTVLRGTGDGRPIVGQPWTDVSDRRLLFLCEETGAGDCTSIGPRLWSPEPIRSFLWGNFCTPPHLLSQGQRTGGLHSHTMDLICFLFGLGSWFCLILHFFPT